MAYHDKHKGHPVGPVGMGILPGEWDFMKPQNPLQKALGGVQKTLNPLDQFLNKPGGSMLMNLLAQSGYGPTPGPGPLGAIGRAWMATQQQQQARSATDLHRQLIESQIGLNQYKASGASTEDGRIGKLTPTLYTPKSVQAFNKTVEAGNPDYSVLEFRPELRIVTDPAGGINIVDVGSSSGDEVGSDGTTPTREVLSSEEAIGLAGERKEREAEAQEDPERRRKTPTNIIKSKQLRNEVNRLIMALRSGELKTGPVQGILSQFTPLGETLGSLSGRQVIDMISDATFGQLSEGERKFLEDITFSGKRTEQFNIQELEKFKEIIDKIVSIQEQDAARLGINDTDIDAIAEKYL